MKNCAETVIIQGRPELKTDACIHLDRYYYGRPHNGHLKGGAYCGHGSFHVQITSDKKRVNCPNCIDRFPENYYS